MARHAKGEEVFLLAMRPPPAWSTEDAIVTPKLGEVQLSADEMVKSTGRWMAERFAATAPVGANMEWRHY